MAVVDPMVVRAAVEGTVARVVLIVPGELDYLDGHFPDVPIVPGVVQVKWAIESARHFLGVSGTVVGLEALKFQKVMRPGDEVTMTLENAADSQKLKFSFQSDHSRYSSGRIVFSRPPP